MPTSQIRLKIADRVALVALCALLAASVSVRVYAYSGASPSPGHGGEAGVIDLGDGLFVPRKDAVHRAVRVEPCPSPATVDAVEPSPHGMDASLVSSPDPNDRVFYAYRGWMLGGRLAAMKLSVLHIATRAGAILRVDGGRARHELAVKIIVPAGCNTSPHDVMAALWRDVQP